MALGAIASVAGRGLIASQFYGVTSSNPWVMIVATAALSGVAAPACVIPARRAAVLDVKQILNSP
jgi:hypothetical protein